jgi:hypothetical protein
MRKRVQIVLAVLLVAIVGVIAWRLLTTTSRSATASAVKMTLAGYTNFPANQRRFALFSVSNQAPYAIRWRGDWVEVEGNPSHWARTIDSRFLGYSSYTPVLKAGESLRLAVGEPSDDSETGHWRFAMSFSRYTWRQRWLDFSFRHKLPLSFGPIVLANDYQISLSNNVTVTTEWLTK